ncbi:hypothetical protein MUG78_17485 [Gordonia alkaliphila]|uniref:hypothetical protein n=1 Tax=Gordonia alkaliphila TaxID=1053547 RepID=UPI001FF668B9|nr:hypothetical protein [Gordonia alkaliphila]MCK0441194.1 hypothetical protein [Gordonia alkaliphila]
MSTNGYDDAEASAIMLEQIAQKIREGGGLLINESSDPTPGQSEDEDTDLGTEVQTDASHSQRVYWVCASE